MASLDFLYDSIDGMRKQNLHFLVICVQNTKKSAHANIIANCPTKKSRKVMKEIMSDVFENMPD